MIINSISLRNFKSYGNALQKLSFNKGGSLILLNGQNANGKSSLLESIDFALFNIVRGKNTKRVPSYILPNRTNKNLEVEIDFVNWNNDNVVINRKLSPKGFKINVNDVDRTDKYELMQQYEKDDIIGIEYNTYKSLVSLNLADFANFINLDTDTKRKLLNKLFNIDEIDIYFSIAKELLKNEYKRREKLEGMVLTNTNTVETYKNNIQNILEITGSKIDKEKMLEYKNSYITLKSEIREMKENLQLTWPDIVSKKEVLQGKRNKIMSDELQLEELSKKLDIFRSGNCPFCGTILTDDSHLEELAKLEEEYREASKDLLEIKKSLNNLKREYSSKVVERGGMLKEIHDKEFQYDIIKRELKDIRDKVSNNISIGELNKNIDILEKENEKYSKGLENLNKRILKYEKLVEILSEKGIRRGIIKTVVDPINEHLSRYLIELESKYNVRLDDSFDAIIKERYIDDIHVESLSTGEARKINVAIALSYMEMVISMNKKTNILFMDEVFASVDDENVDLILKVLRKFSEINDINVIIATPLKFDTVHFDRVINVEKVNGYSFIKEN
jgi:DNA repair exonuclease SbcCD ATPase subunit